MARRRRRADVVADGDGGRDPRRDARGPRRSGSRLDRAVRHLAGQHYVVRLTAPDGYTRPALVLGRLRPRRPREIELTVERLDERRGVGFLHDVVEVGDELEVRGPIGGWFVWQGDTPAVLVGGGSGVVPLMSMLRSAAGPAAPSCSTSSSRSAPRTTSSTRDELTGPDVTVVYSRVTSPGGRAAGRLTAADLPPLDPATQPAYVCGSAGFADAAGQLLVDAGMPPERIKVERFGPTA